MGVVSDVQDYLADQGLVDGATGWASVRRRVHDGQDQLVVITEDGGTRPEIGTNAGIGDNARRFPRVQVRVRGEPFDGDAAAAKTMAIYDALHGLLATTLGDTTYLAVTADTSEPATFWDGNERLNCTISYSLQAAQPVPA